MRLYLVRHGETDSNKQRLLQGHTDSELNEYGRELARRTRDGLKDVPFAAVYTSPLKRAKETARIIMDKRDIPFYEDSRIQEMGFGIYEGLCAEKEHYNVPDPAFLNFFYRPSEYKVPEGGESFQDVMDRTDSFLKELYAKEEYRDQTILIATHGCALKAMLAGIRRLPIDEFWGKGVHKNCAVTVVDVTDGQASVVEEGTIFYE